MARTTDGVVILSRFLGEYADGKGLFWALDDAFYVAAEEASSPSEIHTSKNIMGGGGAFEVTPVALPEFIGFGDMVVVINFLNQPSYT